MKKEIRKDWFFRHPPAVVWEYLTKPELLSQWLMQSDIQPIVGHRFQFRSKPALEIEFDGICYCEILKVVPFKKLSYSWKCSPTGNGYKIDTVVGWTLTPKNNGTELLLRQTGFKETENDLFYGAMNSGWSQRVETLIQNLNGNSQ